MEYFAGLFDAEGCATITPAGSFQVNLYNTNERLVYEMQSHFQGSIYKEKEARKNRKLVWSWRLREKEIIPFCEKIIPYSIVKKPQLLLLTDYLKKTRLEKRSVRPEYVHKMSQLKIPVKVEKDFFYPCESISPDIHFWKWMAGFLEGDGNICIYEYQGAKSIIFDTWIGVFNTFPEPIQFVNQRVNGSISQHKGQIHKIWKWVCSEKRTIYVCDSLIPYLLTKEKQFRLLLDFYEIKKTKIREQSYSHNQINNIREIIKQVKHLNST